MAENVNKVLKALMPLVNARLKAIESGKVVPGQALPGQSASILDSPNYTGGLNLKDYTTPVSTGGNKPNMHYTTLTPGGVSALNSVRRLQAQLPAQHHSSFLGKVWHDVEKPFHAVTGGLGALEDYQKTPEGHSWSLKSLGKSFEKLGSGAAKGWEGKSKYSNIADVLAQDPIAKHQPNKLRAVEGFLGDVGLDPVSYVGVGGLTKVKNLARTADDLKKVHDAADELVAAGHVNPGEVEHTFLNPQGKLAEGKWVGRKTIATTAQRASVMANAKKMATQYGDLSFEKTYQENIKAAEKSFQDKGLYVYKTLGEFQKKMMPGASHGDLIKWNADLKKDITTLAGKLTGERVKHVTSKAEELLSIAARNNLAGDAAQVRSQLDRALGLKFAGKTVAKVKLPAKLGETTSALANADALKGVKEFSDSMHDHFNTLFRTGSHLDPIVNTIRLARTASVVERANQHLRNMNSIWGKVNRATRKDVAHATVQGLDNVKYAGGHDFISGKNVEDLVGHSTDIIRHIEHLVRKGQFTFHEFNNTLPSLYKLDKAKYGNDPEFLMHAWKDQFLNPSAPRYLKMVGEDPNVFLNLMQKAAYSAMADREQVAQHIARFGHKIFNTKLDKNGVPTRIGKKDPVTRLLVENHGYRTPRLHPDAPPNTATGKAVIPQYTGHVFQEDVARSIERMHQLVHSDAAYNKVGMHSVGKLFNDVTALFKTIVTKYNPGFHERNFIGEVVNSMGDGVLSVKPYRIAAKVLMGKEKRGAVDLATGAKGNFRVANAINPDAYHLAKLGTHSTGSSIVLDKHFIGLDTTGVTSDQLWHAYVESGLKAGWIATDTGKYAGRMALGSAGVRVSDFTQHITENIEDYTRLAHFVSRLQRSKLKQFDDAVEEAAQYVRKFHFDYTDFTHFERTVMSKIFPFYKWTRKNIPLQMALLFQRPGYFLAQMKALGAISNAQGFPNAGRDVPLAEDVMPQWLKDHLAVPVGVGGSGVRYLDAPLPTLQAAQFFGSGIGDTTTNAAYMLNPLAKVPLELKTGHQIGGAPIQKKKYFSSLTPYSNLIYNLGNQSNTGKGTNMLQFMLGLGLVENTPARIKGELKREQSQLATQRKKYRKQQGLTPLGHVVP